jgi:hypothetical protein
MILRLRPRLDPTARASRLREQPAKLRPVGLGSARHSSRSTLPAPCFRSAVTDQLAAGDVLTVTRLDRLARSTRGLLNTLAAITAKEALVCDPGRRMG